MPALTNRLTDLFTGTDFGDPFGSDFDKKKLTDNLADASKKEIEFVEVAALINGYYQGLIRDILVTLQEFNFSGEDLIDGFFAKANIHVISLSQNIHQAFSNNRYGWLPR